MHPEGRGAPTWISASVVGNVYADACHWEGTLLDPPVGANFDALVAALANQLGTSRVDADGRHAGGYAGKRMELTVPARINVADCDNGQFRFWTYGLGESDYRNTPFTGEHGRLWILDVDGVRLVIEAAWPLGASAQVQAELTPDGGVDPDRLEEATEGIRARSGAPERHHSTREGAGS